MVIYFLFGYCFILSTLNAISFIVYCLKFNCKCRKKDLLKRKDLIEIMMYDYLGDEPCDFSTYNEDENKIFDLAYAVGEKLYKEFQYSDSTKKEKSFTQKSIILTLCQILRDKDIELLDCSIPNEADYSEWYNEYKDNYSKISEEDNQLEFKDKYNENEYVDITKELL